MKEARHFLTYILICTNQFKKIKIIAALLYLFLIQLQLIKILKKYIYVFNSI